jgi:hypothetical protein
MSNVIVEEEIHDAAWWSNELDEPKVHVVEKVLEEVGQEVMAEFVSHAREDFKNGQAKTLGGAFMKVIKQVVVPGGNLYDLACDGEENTREVARQKKRSIRRNKNS